MKTSLEHLPERKQDELEIIVRMMREDFDVEMIILFGSYARGDWVEELGPDDFYYTYQSDFDILVVADNKRAYKHRKWDKLEDRIRRSSVVQTPVTLIHHSIGYFNAKLSKGHYFFSDIKKEGLLLYDSKRYELEELRELTSSEYKEKAQEYYDHWFISANEFLIDYEAALDRQSYKNSAFYLHQTTERCYSALLLVLTDYLPKTHDIETLGKTGCCSRTEITESIPQKHRRRTKQVRTTQKSICSFRTEIHKCI